MNAPWVTTEAIAAATAAEWADIRALVRERVAAMVELAGQRGRPSVRFDPRLTAMESATSVDVGSPLVYKPMPLQDQICVHLTQTIGETPPPVSAVPIDTLDGALLHELGHRRDRWLMTLLLGHGLTWATLLAGMAVLAAAPGNGLLMLIGTALCAAAIAVGFGLHGCRVPIGRWFEHRADDYMLDTGGRVRCEAALAWFGIREELSGGPGQSPVHDAVADRRARQARR